MTELADLRRRLHRAFGKHADCHGPLAASGAAIRLTGLNLSRPLVPKQVSILLDALSVYRIVTIPGQDLATFTLADFERFANHWGAPVPHPSNFTRGGGPAQSDSPSDGAIAMIPPDKRAAAAVNAALPGRLRCLPHDSPAVLTVANVRSAKSEPRVAGGGSWHTDIEYERLPIYVSMFLVHAVPTRRDAPGGNWVATNGKHPYFDGADAELMRRRLQLPRNGETAYADTAAAFAALPTAEQERLRKVRVRRRLNAGDPGWLAPLVRSNPRSGIESLHSPVWASRPRVRPPITVDGLSETESRGLLDALEAHVLKADFRYDHLHEPGDVTIWDNTMTLHNSPPMKVNVDEVEDARLLYRLSCKGEPALTLPRADGADWLAAHVPGGYRTPARVIQAVP